MTTMALPARRWPTLHRELWLMGAFTQSVMQRLLVSGAYCRNEPCHGGRNASAKLCFPPR